MNAQIEDTSPRGDLLRLIDRLRRNIEAVLKGKTEAVDLVLTALIARGHVLIEDVPGVGKTTLARALARSIEGSFRRIQFTSDLLPADIIGTAVFHQSRSEFEFKPGPIFANVVLADEINRTTPKTQSSLLEAMNERQVSVDGVTHHLEEPFMVAATQNPHEFYGTYPLPESQLDRFLLRIRLGYPGAPIERDIISQGLDASDRVNAVESVITGEQVVGLQKAVEEIRFDDSLLDYVMEIVAATRTSGLLELGISTRGAMMLHRAARAYALIHGRDYCLPDDIKRLVISVGAHRVVPMGQRDGGVQDRTMAERALRDIVKTVSVPV